MTPRRKANSVHQNGVQNGVQNGTQQNGHVKTPEAPKPATQPPPTQQQSELQNDQTQRLTEQGQKSAVPDIEDIVPGTKKEKTKGFMLYTRKAEPYIAPEERLKTFAEITTDHSPQERKKQAARSVDIIIMRCLGELTLIQVYGLWSTLLPVHPWLPHSQPHPRME